MSGYERLSNQFLLSGLLYLFQGNVDCDLEASLDAACSALRSLFAYCPGGWSIKILKVYPYHLVGQCRVTHSLFPTVHCGTVWSAVCL